MGEHHHLGVGVAERAHVAGGEALVDLAAALPEDDLDVGLLRHVAAEVLVGQEDHPLAAERLDHLDGVGRGAADVGLRLHLGGGVDVGDHRHAGIALAQQPHVGPGDRRGERAAGLEVGDQDGLLGVQDLRRLGHEVDAAEDDHVGVGLGRLARQGERVAGEVGDAVEDLRRLVVVRQDHRVPLLLEAPDRGDVGRVDRPLDLGHHASHALEDRRHLRAERGRGNGTGGLGAGREDAGHIHLREQMLRLSIKGVSKNRRRAGLRLRHAFMLNLSISSCQAHLAQLRGEKPRAVSSA